MPIPPERRDHVGGELAAPRQQRRRQRLGQRPGVLPTRDAEGVKVLLRKEDRALPLVERGRRHHPLLQVDKAPSCIVPVGSPAASRS